MKSVAMKKWDAKFLLLCEMIASWSKDESRKVGCVIIGKNNEVISTGYNGIVRGLDDDITDRHSRANGSKYMWFEHAERNAIYNAVRTGTRLEGSRIYINYFPCADCARAAIQTGIVEICTYEPNMLDPVFGRHYEIAIEMIQESGLTLRLFDRTDGKFQSQRERFVASMVHNVIVS